ncbi:MAG: M23 family metallopeptidase [bacterium]
MVIQCNWVKVLLAYIMKNSIVVQTGDTLQTGQPLGRIGNSGNTSEPHLHIHAEKLEPNKPILEGEGVPIVFDGRFLVRNSLIFSRK